MKFDVIALFLPAMSVAVGAPPSHRSTP
jgi:hypothetical protein